MRSLDPNFQAALEYLRTTDQTRAAQLEEFIARGRLDAVYADFAEVALREAARAMGGDLQCDRGPLEHLTSALADQGLVGEIAAAQERAALRFLADSVGEFLPVDSGALTPAADPRRFIGVASIKGHQRAEHEVAESSSSPHAAYEQQYVVWIGAMREAARRAGRARQFPA